MEPEELQLRLTILFELIEQGKADFYFVPETVAALQRVRRLPDRTFDLTTVDSPVRALCLLVDQIIEPSSPPADYEPLDQLPLVNLPNLERRRVSDSDFLADLVEAANVVRQYLALVAGLWPTRQIDRLLRGILVGHVVRMFKLYDTLIMMVVAERGEICLLLARVLVDTVINLRHLLRNPTDAEVRAYIEASLAHEKKLKNEIEKRMRRRRRPLAIERRMLRSIEMTFRRAGVHPDSIAAREWRATSTFRKAREAGLETLYEFGFRITSHEVHGTWHDLEFHHLEKKDGEYRPEPRFSQPGPQIVEMASVASLDASVAYLDFVVAGSEADEVRDKLNEVCDWFMKMSHRHERWLQRKRPKPGL